MTNKIDEIVEEMVDILFYLSSLNSIEEVREEIEKIMLDIE